MDEACGQELSLAMWLMTVINHTLGEFNLFWELVGTWDHGEGIRGLGLVQILPPQYDSDKIK